MRPSIWHIWLSPFTRVEKTHLFQKDPPIWSLLSVVKCFALQYLWSATYFHVRIGCAPTRFLNAKSPAVTFKKSRKLILPFFLEEETHLMHMKCCASASFLNDSLATCTIDRWYPNFPLQAFNNNQQINCQLCNCKCCNLSRICRCRSRLINHNKAILWMLLSFVMVIIFAARGHSDYGIMNDNE